MSKVIVERDELGVSLHTALRKCCDSIPTTMAWIIINLMPFKIWNTYLELLSIRLESEPITSDGNLIERVKRFSLEYDVVGDAYVQLLNLSFRLFEENDWFRYVTYLDGLIEPVVKEEDLQE